MKEYKASDHSNYKAIGPSLPILLLHITASTTCGDFGAVRFTSASIPSEGQA